MSLKKQAKNIQKVGYKNSGQDSMLAHITPLEAMMLKAHGGSGRTDPKTGLPHFDDAGGDYGGWGDGGLGGLGDAGGDGSYGDGYGNSYGGDPGEGFGGYGGWGDAGDPSGFGDEGSLSLDNVYGDFNPSTDYFGEQAGLNFGPSESNPYGASTSPDQWGNKQDDFLSRLSKFSKQFAMNKALSTLAQSNPVLGQVASLASPALSPNQDTPVGQQIAGKMVDMMAAPVQGPVQGLVGLANLFGADINLPSIGQGLAHANLDYKGMPEGSSGFGNSTTGQTGTGFDNVLNGAATLAGLFGQLNNYRQNNNQANNLSGMFGPNSAYAKQLEQTLARRDAAAGRRSQYGPRSVELQAKLAQMASGVAPNILAARNSGNKSLMDMLGMLTSANKMGVFDPVKGWMNGMFGNNTSGFSMPSTPYTSDYTPSENYFSTGFGI